MSDMNNKFSSSEKIYHVNFTLNYNNFLANTKIEILFLELGFLFECNRYVGYRTFPDRTTITEHTQSNELRSTCNQPIHQAKRKNTLTLINVEESFIQTDTSFYQYE